MGRIAGTRASGWGRGCRFGDPCGPRTAHPPLSGLGPQVPPVLLPKPRLAPGWGDLEGLWPGPGRPSRCRAAPHPMYLAARTTAGPAGQPPAPSSCGATTSAASAHQGLAGPLDLWEVGQRALPGASQGPGPPAPASNNGPHTGPQARHWARMVISHPDSRGGGVEVTAVAGGVSCPPKRLRPSLAASALQCWLVSPRPVSPPETQVQASATGAWPRGPSSCRPLSGTVNHESAVSSPGALLRAFRSEIQLWCFRWASLSHQHCAGLPAPAALCPPRASALLSPPPGTRPPLTSPRLSCPGVACPLSESFNQEGQWETGPDI